jgi:thioredoxin 1
VKPPRSGVKEEYVAKPVEVTDSTFEQEVIKAEKPVLVDFWASWCGPCRIIGPVLAEIADERQEHLKIVKVNIDDNYEYASMLGVTTVPTMVIFKDGEAIDKLVGAMPKRSIDARLDRALS